jgi:hypothetical protein
MAGIVNWGIAANALAQPNMGQTFQGGFERGMTQGSLHTLSRDPNDPRALNALFAVAPELAIRMEDRRHRLGERAREAEGRGALADYLLGSQPSPAASTGFGPAQPSMTGTNALLAMGAGPAAPASPWERAVRADPAAALQVQGGQLDNQRRGVQLSQDQFELLRDLNEASLQLLGSVQSAPAEQRQAAYEQAIARAQALYGRFGLDLSALNLPAQYDEATVDGLLRSAMRTRDQFGVMTAERRLDWDIEDDRTDNARADRGLASLDAYRQGQLGNTRRGQDMTDARVRRGQDMRSSDTRRGQDMRSGDTRRGQNMRGRGGGRGGNAAVIVNPQTGQRMILQGGRWVPVQ